MLKKVQESMNDEKEKQMSSAGRLIDEKKTKKKKSDMKKVVFEEWVATKREISSDCGPVKVLYGLRVCEMMLQLWK